MKRLQTTGIVLSRTKFGEADRIITVLTPGFDKLRLMARGVRKPKSKLAGGIELFSVSDLTFIEGKAEIGILISSRLSQHFSQIISDIERVQLGYELMSMLNKATEDNLEPEYFDLLEVAFAALNAKVDISLTNIWFQAQLLKLAGHSPNLQTDVNGQKLAPGQAYDFDYDAIGFSAQPKGGFKADDIKLLRLLFSNHSPNTIGKVSGVEKLLNANQYLIKTMLQNHLDLS